jgi:inward rectifier potassium channel
LLPGEGGAPAAVLDGGSARTQAHLPGARLRSGPVPTPASMTDPAFDTPASSDETDLGFGTVAGGVNEKRLLNRDGTFTPRRVGMPFFKRLHAYHFLLSISWPRFIGYVASGYIAINLIFALAYLACGPDALAGQAVATFGGYFGRAFFFSIETITTIGFGNIQPIGVPANLLVVLEALTGLLILALGTGILFARFSRPTAAIAFSERAVVAPYRGITGLMFRLTNQRANQLIELKAKVLFSRIEAGGRQYDQLTLERTKVVFLPLSWTIVHPIDEESPMYGLTWEDLQGREAEFLVLLSGTDETFSQTVHARTSYKAEDVVFGERFVNIYNPVAPDGTVSIDVRKLGKTEPAPVDKEWLETRTWEHTGHFRGYAPPRPPPQR